MFVTMNRVYVAPAYYEAFAERFRQGPHHVQQVPGFIRNLVLRPAREGDPHVVLTLWESQEAFAAWVGSEAFRAAHARASLPPEAFTQPSRLETYEVVAELPRG